MSNMPPVQKPGSGMHDHPGNRFSKSGPGGPAKTEKPDSENHAHRFGKEDRMPRTPVIKQGYVTND